MSYRKKRKSWWRNTAKAPVEVAQRKASAFQKDCREKDLALMLLTEVEKLTENL